MKRPWHIGTAFLCSLAVMLVALAWLTRTVLKLEDAQKQAARQAEVEENVRLALWRMDSFLTPLLAQENSRPYFAYSALFSPQRPYTQMFDALRAGDTLAPSPLLLQTPPHAFLHFQIAPDGTFSSPQVPAATDRDVGRDCGVAMEKISEDAARLNALRAAIKPANLLALLPEEKLEPQAILTLAQEESEAAPVAALPPVAPAPPAPAPNPLVQVEAPARTEQPASVPVAPERPVWKQENIPEAQNTQAAEPVPVQKAPPSEAIANLPPPASNLSARNLPDNSASPSSNLFDSANFNKRQTVNSPDEQQARSDNEMAMRQSSVMLNSLRGQREAQAKSQQQVLRAEPNSALQSSRSPRRAEIPPVCKAAMPEARAPSPVPPVALARIPQRETVAKIPAAKSDESRRPVVQTRAPATNAAPPAPVAPCPAVRAEEARAIVPRNTPPPVNVAVGLMRPLWAGDKLLLVRRVATSEKRTYLQGAWLNWPVIESSLLESIGDLLPNARLTPTVAGSSADQTHQLAALPVTLFPGALPFASTSELTPLRLSLFIAWACVLLAALAVGVLLAGAVSLSERRGAFVSAVTHELRTPLTTFRMYTQMLAEGMLPSAEKRARYLATLQVEADRLSHLVENVLAYARLERGRAAGRVENLACAELLAKVTERLHARAAQAGMKLECSAPQNDLFVRTDTSAVEQILFNLVDNACKYAVSATDRRLVIEPLREGRFLALRVRDFGPGITPKEARKLFQPFSKSAREAAHSAPGVGLGLALSRRLAREMGGELRLDLETVPGACFVLRLPLADR